MFGNTKASTPKIQKNTALVLQDFEPSMEDRIFIAKYVVGKLNTEDLVQFADQKLTDGVYSEHLLNIMDDGPEHWNPVSEYFESFVEEKGYAVPSFEQAVWVLLRYHILLISQGNVSPSKQFRQLLDDIESFDLHKGIKKYVGDNIGIENMYGWYHSDCSTIEETDSGIFNESLDWVEKFKNEH